VDPRLPHVPIPGRCRGSCLAEISSRLLNASVPNLGTDSGLDNNTLSIFHEMKMAALVQKSVAGDPQAINAGEIIKMATIEGGRIAELPVGSLSSGQRADFTVIEEAGVHDRSCRFLLSSMHIAI
jgi:5-methylthioadenosine/S-adenosylhomocysteine deaminase